MSLRTPLLLLLGATLAACGAEAPSSGARLGLDVMLDRAVADELDSFQVAVLPDGRSRSCTELQQSCLKERVRAEELLMLRGPNGKESRAPRFSVGLQGGVQELSVEVPVGTDYVVVIEAISRHTPPQLLGSSCNYLAQVNATRNEPLLAAPITLTPMPCDPTF
jgi:hypothetical protein